MRAFLIAGALLGTMLLSASVLAGEPNAEVGKAIQEIAARRALKEETRAKQAEGWAQGERAWSGGAINVAPGAPMPGATIRVNPK